MRRFWAVVAVLALVLAGCGETSNLDRSAAVVVSGRVLRADGTPAGGVPVALEREPSVGEIFTGLVVIPLTLFTACLTDPPAALCRGRSVKRTKTAADGTYSFNMTGDDTQTAFGNARSFTLTTGTGEQAGPAVTANFKIQTEALVLPDLQLWQPAVTVAPGRIGWSPPADGEYRVGLEDTAGQLVWTFESPRAEVVFDPRILEDTAGSLAVSARTTGNRRGDLGRHPPPVGSGRLSQHRRPAPLTRPALHPGGGSGVGDPVPPDRWQLRQQPPAGDDHDGGCCGDHRPAAQGRGDHRPGPACRGVPDRHPRLFL